MAIKTNFQKADDNKADTIVVGIYEKNTLSDAAELLDNEMDGLIRGALKENQQFKGKSGQTLILSSNGKSFKRIVAVGLGKEADMTRTAIETVGGKLYGTLKAQGSQNVNIRMSRGGDLENITAGKMAAHMAIGVHLKSYDFDKYKSANDKKDNSLKLEKLVITTNAHADANGHYKEELATSEGVFLARDLVNEPPNNLYPESYVERLKDELKPLGVEIEILDEKKMKKLGMGALLAVGQGSIRESRMAIMHWNGDKKSKKSKRAPIAFVGKGVTFDTGGISLKPGAEMDLMKMDMGGSAAVVGLMKALASRKAKANVIGIIGLVENMPSDRAYRPGDIIQSMSGKTIEVLNTDAEGRLVLADALTYIQEEYNPEIIIDLATLTGAIMVGLGFEYCGSFVNDNELWGNIENASNLTGEKFWRMPLDAAYKKEMESEVADLKNLGNNRYGGACTAAGFLEHFIQEDTKWAHIDIAGTAWWKSDKPTTPKGGTGFAVRALDALVKDMYE
ncbi:MAG: leucyl aminopeptidase [Pseudomonadota bacterium]